MTRVSSGLRALLAALSLSATLAACSEPTSTLPAPDRTLLIVLPDTVGVGDTIWTSAFAVLHQSGDTVPIFMNVLVSSDTSVLRPLQFARVVALREGTVTIAAEWPLPYSGIAPDSERVVVGRRARTVRLVAPRDSVAPLDTLTVRAELFDRSGAAMSSEPARFASSDTLVARVDSLTGAVRVLSDGDATITAIAHGHAATVRLRSYLRPLETGGVRLARITLGWNFGCGTDAAGVGYCWGMSRVGQLGRGIHSTGFEEHPLAAIQTTSRYVDIQAGRAAACGLTTSGALECWGAAMYGISGPSPSLVSTPAVVPMPEGFGRIVSLHVGNRPAACVIDDRGAHACFGSNSYWAIGADTTFVARPRAVPGLVGPIASIATGEGHGCAVTTASELRCWGRWGSSWGGADPHDGNVIDVATMPSPSRVAALWDGTCVLDGAGAPWCGGMRDSLGVWSVRPLTRLANAPALVRLHSNASASCGFATTGDLYCWDDLRTLNDSPLMWSETPLRFSRRHKFVDFGISAHGICALTTEGAVLCRTRRFGQQ